MSPEPHPSHTPVEAEDTWVALTYCPNCGRLLYVDNTLTPAAGRPCSPYVPGSA